MNADPESLRQPKINPLVIPDLGETDLTLYNQAIRFYPQYTIRRYDTLPGSQLPILAILHQQVDITDDYFKVIELLTDQAIHVNPNFPIGESIQPSSCRERYLELVPEDIRWSDEDADFYLYFDNLDDAILRVCRGLSKLPEQNLRIAAILFPMDTNTEKFRPYGPTIDEETRNSLIKIMQLFNVGRVCGYRRAVTSQGEANAQILEYPFV